MPSHNQESTAPTGQIVVTTLSDSKKAGIPHNYKDPRPNPADHQGNFGLVLNERCNSPVVRNDVSDLG
jgi:hypothetical protein